MNAKYRAKEIVWAKIDPYPWWPGKIINIHVQCNEIIYKILFFADATFAYLQESQLCHYHNFNPNNNTQCPADSKLIRATKLADRAQNKIQSLHGTKEFKMSLQCKKTQIEVNKSSSSEVPTTTKQSHSYKPLQQKGPLSNLLTIQQRPIVQQPANGIQQQNSNSNVFAKYGQITKNNILDILSKRIVSQQRFQYNYENRKKVIQNKMRLKRILLQRYNLHHQYLAQVKVQTSKKITQNQGKKSTSYGLKRFRTHNKKKFLNKNLPYLKDKCIRKLYHICRQMSKSQDKVIDCKQMCSDLVKKIFLTSQQNQSKYQDLFLNLIKSIYQNGISQAKSVERTLADMNVWLQKMESQKHEDEQGSKMTQIPSISQ